MAKIPSHTRRYLSFGTIIKNRREDESMIHILAPTVEDAREIARKYYQANTFARVQLIRLDSQPGETSETIGPDWAPAHLPNGFKRPAEPYVRKDGTTNLDVSRVRQAIARPKDVPSPGAKIPENLIGRP